LVLPDEGAAGGEKSGKTLKISNPPAVVPPAKGSLKPWCIGVLLGDKVKRIYLFDHKLGLPIPGPSGIAADEFRQLNVQPATLDEVQSNSKLLDRLALGPESPYWAQKANLKQVIALVEASPLYVAPRAKRIESRLTGDQKLVLNAEPSWQAEHLRAAGIGEVRLWELPYTTLQRRLALDSNEVIDRLLAYFPFMGLPGSPLYKGRIMHLKGRFYNEKEAIADYQKARPRNRTVAEEMPKIEKAGFELLCSQWKEHGRNLTPEVEKELKQIAAWEARQVGSSIIQGKLAASYWLGLIQYDVREFVAALDYFSTRTLQFGPSVFWAAGAHYNIARTLEANGNRQQAIRAYETDIFLRNDTGNLIRARWLRELDRKSVV
jgi:tetratricopeptide (TPR) repeat protein